MRAGLSIVPKNCIRRSTRSFLVRATSINGTKRTQENLTCMICFTTETEAEEHGVELGKHWVNNRIQCMQRFPQASIEQRRLLADGLTAGANMQITDSVCISGERLWFSREWSSQRG